MDDKVESAEDYLKKYHHPETISSWSNPTAADLETIKKADAEAQQEVKQKQESEAEGRGKVGALVGGYAAHKNLIPRAFKKALSGSPEVYGGTTPAATGNATRMRVEPTVGEPLIPHDVAGTHPSTVNEVMTSARGDGEPTGRQKRQGHNMTAQREKWELEQKLKQQPSAKTAIINFGPEYPRESGIIIPEHVGTQMEEEARRAHAERQALDAQAARDASLRAERAAQNAADAQAAAARRAEMVGKGVNLAKGAAKVGAGALGGYFAGKDIVDIAPTVWKKGFHADQYTPEEKNKLLNTAGGLSMMIPTVPTQVLGGALIGKGHQDELMGVLNRLAPQRRFK